MNKLYLHIKVMAVANNLNLMNKMNNHMIILELKRMMN
jgi:hypothetical protein